MREACEAVTARGRQEGKDGSASPWLGPPHPTLGAGSLREPHSPAGRCGGQRAHLSSEEGLWEGFSEEGRVRSAPEPGGVGRAGLGRLTGALEVVLGERARICRGTEKGGPCSGAARAKALTVPAMLSVCGGGARCPGCQGQELGGKGGSMQKGRQGCW